MAGMIETYRSLPRAAKWLLSAALVVGVYFGVVEPVIDATARVDSSADLIESRLEQEADLMSQDQNRATLVRALGTPALPDEDVGRRAAFQTAVDGVFAEHGVPSKEQTEQTAPVRLGDEHRGLIDADQQLERIELLLRFEATPETISAIVADLEASDSVTAVTQLKMDRRARRSRDDNSRLVGAQLGVETWLIAKRRSRR